MSSGLQKLVVSPGGTGLLAAATFSSLMISGQTRTIDPCASARDLRLANGNIVTMDARSTIMSGVTTFARSIYCQP